MSNRASPLFLLRSSTTDVARRRIIRAVALQVKQNGSRPLYLFSLTPQQLHDVADISRVGRDDAGTLIGYQRPAVRRHIRGIVEYLMSEEVIFPNSIILALTSGVRFQRSRNGPKVNGGGLTVAGTLEIPISPNDAKPAWIVDGQQRALALREAEIDDFPVPVSAFITDEVEVQREQFLRVNNVRSLPRGLVSELLPTVAGPLPAKLAAQKIPSALCEILNEDTDSPFHRLIRRASTPAGARRRAVVTDTAVVKTLEESLNLPSGCLFPYHNIATGENDLEAMRSILFAYWHGVKSVFADAWGLSPRHSRLMHSVGIRAMGRLMDRVMASVDVQSTKAQKEVAKRLQVVAPVCSWTSGRWEDIGLLWNELQSTPGHIRALSNLLVRSYLNG